LYGSALLAAVLVLALLGSSAIARTTRAVAATDDPATMGSFSNPFAEPTIDGQATSDKCIKKSDGTFDCKPAAGSMAILDNGKILYWNALEGTENVSHGIALDFGKVSINDQTRLMDLNGGNPIWSQPSPVDGGANPNGYQTHPLIPELSSHEKYNDGALFCSDLQELADGRILAVGGTAYYNDPGSDSAPVGVVELEGLNNARVYDPGTNTWVQTGSMQYGRWYPTMVTLPDGKVFIASGVKKLLKPVYPDSPQDSGTNVKQTETYDPSTGKWTYNGASADYSLPLFPRLQLLPDGHVFFNAAGQDFNPSGQSYDEPTWNFTASYDPSKKQWTQLGLADAGTLTPGFRGSTFSLMLPLTPDQSGAYTSASFLSAGGVLGTTPGSYLAVPTSAITTVDTSKGESVSTVSTGDLAEPRWYSTGVVLPTGQVLAFSGANRDEVVGPGTGFPVTDAELFDPHTQTWTPLANGHDARTYHNTAALLPDGRVLVGGHAPISTLYGTNQTLPGGFSPNDGRDPSFEIYSPPYMFWGPRPKITKLSADDLGYGSSVAVHTDVPATTIESVALVRNTSITHLVDGDQRTVDLPIIKAAGHTLVVATPPNGNVAPPGPYMLFVNQRTDKGLVPSESRQVFVAR
jgi:hypothetical protein